MKNLLILFIAVLSAVIVLSSCQKEEEVIIEPSTLQVQNNSESPFDIYIRNIDKNTVEIYAGNVEGNASLTIPLELGYTYEAKAIEDVSQGEPSTISKSFLVNPHVKLRWNIPFKANQ